MLWNASDSAAGEASVSVSAQMTRATTRTLPIFYDSAMTAKGFPSPLLRVRIAGHEAMFPVDSGASTHVLADWFVRTAGIPSSETNSTVKGSGGKTAPERAVHQLHGYWSDGRSFNLNEAAVVSFPSYFESLQIGGLLSPQLLAPSGLAAVLNLKAPPLNFSPFSKALSDLRLSKSSKLTINRATACRNSSSVFENREYVTPVAAGRVADLMLVDTGATKTILSRESKIVQAIEMRSEPGTSTESVGGAVDARRVVHGVQLMRGGARLAVNPSIGSVEAPCSAMGILGMDALQGCVLVLGAEELALSCKPAT